MGFSILSLLIVYLFNLKTIIVSFMTSLKLKSPSHHQNLSWVGHHLLHHEKNNSSNNILLEKNISLENSQIESDHKTSYSDNLNGSIKLKKRPARLVLPDVSVSKRGMRLDGINGDCVKKEFEIEGRDFVLACKKGSRQVMEDGYGFLVDVNGDPKQAFFAVIDGHGGRAATEYAAENLGKNIVKKLENVKREDEEEAIRSGYLVTDQQFLSQGVGSGACAASVVFRNGELHVANVGDCRVVLSRNGVAESLTIDHRLHREDERFRIENSGGFILCPNGVWRVQGSLAVSRAIGDIHLKDWIISEPEIRKITLTSDCQFLILASDGLWDKVDVQEAVDVVSEDKRSIESCKKLIEISSSRGNLDDITVMVINLQQFLINS